MVAHLNATAPLNYQLFRSYQLSSSFLRYKLPNIARPAATRVPIQPAGLDSSPVRGMSRLRTFSPDSEEFFAVPEEAPAFDATTDVFVIFVPYSCLKTRECAGYFSTGPTAVFCPEQKNILAVLLSLPVQIPSHPSSASSLFLYVCEALRHTSCMRPENRSALSARPLDVQGPLRPECSLLQKPQVHVLLSRLKKAHALAQCS